MESNQQPFEAEVAWITWNLKLNLRGIARVVLLLATEQSLPSAVGDRYSAVALFGGISEQTGSALYLVLKLPHDGKELLVSIDQDDGSR